MIYTVTFNPSLDYIVDVPDFQAGQLNRTRREKILPGGEGAVFISENGDVITGAAPEGKVVNSVGAGDSMVAGFLTGYIESGGDYEKAFRMGLCAGSASAFSPELASREETEALLRQTLYTNPGCT